jgi:hypothetical protein
MNGNYKEISFLFSSLFVIYFFKDLITSLVILFILLSICVLFLQNNYVDDNDIDDNENFNFTKTSNFIYNR